MSGRNWNPAPLPAPLSLQEVQAAHPDLGRWGWSPAVEWEPIVPEEFDRAAAYLAAVARPLRYINRRRCSYGRKHQAERWAGDYIANGALTAAALAYGFRHHDDGPNSQFNLGLLRRARRVTTLLKADGEPAMLAAMLVLVHAWADALGVRYMPLSDAIDSAMHDSPPDAEALCRQIDSSLGKEPGDSLMAFGQALRKAAA